MAKNSLQKLLEASAQLGEHDPPAGGGDSAASSSRPAPSAARRPRPTVQTLLDRGQTATHLAEAVQQEVTKQVGRLASRGRRPRGPARVAGRASSAPGAGGRRDGGDSRPRCRPRNQPPRGRPAKRAAGEEGDRPRKPPRRRQPPRRRAPKAAARKAPAPTKAAPRRRRPRRRRSHEGGASGGSAN